LQARDRASLILVQEGAESPYEVVPHGATDASVAEQEGVLIESLDEVMVEAHFVELIDEHGRTLGARS
jgi:hypothetical protein